MENLTSMEKSVIPRKTVYRLSLYHRSLQKLKNNGMKTVSSSALAGAAGVKSTQLRKDLAYFGSLGTRGLGYSVEDLSKTLTAVLGTTHLQPVILVGVGNLGAALLDYQGFERQGFEVICGFDQDLDRIIEGVEITVLGMEQMKAFVQEKEVKMAILTVPGTAAQEVTNRLVEAGIQGILNFAPTVLQVPEHVVVNNVDLALELENLSYFIS